MAWIPSVHPYERDPRPSRQPRSQLQRPPASQLLHAPRQNGTPIRQERPPCPGPRPWRPQQHDHSLFLPRAHDRWARAPSGAARRARAHDGDPAQAGQRGPSVREMPEGETSPTSLATRQYGPDQGEGGTAERGTVPRTTRRSRRGPGSLVSAGGTGHPIWRVPAPRRLTVLLMADWVSRWACVVLPIRMCGLMRCFIRAASCTTTAGGSRPPRSPPRPLAPSFPAHGVSRRMWASTATPDPAIPTPCPIAHAAMEDSCPVRDKF